MSSQRISWIDTARGIGIIFVIYAHALGSHSYGYLFYAFHIPLFFFLSGILFKEDHNFVMVLKKSAKRLLIPYFSFAFIMYGLWFYRIAPHTNTPEIIRQFLSIFYGNSNNGLMAFNDVLWFLPVLFITRMLFTTLTRISRKTNLLLVILLFFSIFGYLFSIFAPKIKLPFGSEVAFSAVVFYGAGYLWNKSEKAKKSIIHYRYFLFPILVIVGGMLATMDFKIHGHQIDMRLSHLNNYFLFYCNAFAGIFAWIAFSMIIKRNVLLEICGKNSLILFAWHPIVFSYLAIIVTHFISVELINSIRIFTPAIYSILAILIILLIHMLLKKIVLSPFQIRMKKNEKR